MSGAQTTSRNLSAVLDDRAALAGFARLSVAMVITNPNAPDNPIVYVNEAFERVTGYNRSSVIGRNCRFLQGDATEEGAIAQMVHALRERRACNVIVTNYKKGGQSFRHALTAVGATIPEGDLVSRIVGPPMLHTLEAMGLGQPR